MVTRNEDICRLYTEGKTVAELAPQFNISRERVRQVLRKADVFKKYRDMDRTDRDAFLGVNITQEAKDALRVKAEEEGKSMSQLVSDKIEEMVE